MAKGRRHYNRSREKESLRRHSDHFLSGEYIDYIIMDVEDFLHLQRHGEFDGIENYDVKGTIKGIEKFLSHQKLTREDVRRIPALVEDYFQKKMLPDATVNIMGYNRYPSDDRIYAGKKRRRAAVEEADRVLKSHSIPKPRLEEREYTLIIYAPSLPDAPKITPKNPLKLPRHKVYKSPSAN
jgi:hypothetical protein